MELTAKEIQKYKCRTETWLKKKAQTVFNKFIRLRDKEKGCVSCASNKVEHASHYMSQGHHSALRFNEDNCQGSCIRCNLYLSGNLLNYRKGLIKRIGLERVEALENAPKKAHRWDKIELITIIKIYSLKTKQLKCKQPN